MDADYKSASAGNRSLSEVERDMDADCKSASAGNRSLSGVEGSTLEKHSAAKKIY